MTTKQRDAQSVEHKRVKLSALVPTYTRDSNPNRMSTHELSALVALIKAEGFLQPILVTPVKGKKGMYSIIDGHHRYWACEEAGKEEIDVVVKPASGPLAASLGIGMNHIRGELDLSASGRILQDAILKASWSIDQAALLSGFTQSELEAITTDTLESSDELLEDVDSANIELEDAGSGAAKPFVLEIAFTDKDQYRLARRKLRKASGATKNLAVGLMAVLGEDADG